MSDPDALLTRDNVDPGQLAEAILERHYARLHFLAYSILGDADEADDAVQDGLIAALDNIGRYRPGSNLKAWLSAIVVNQCRDRLRRHQARQALLGGLQWLWRNRPAQRSAEASSVNDEARSALWSSVDKLGEKHRLPIILRYVHDLSTREIAQILDIREGTVHSRLHYACQRLRGQLAVDDIDALVEELRHE